MCALRARMLACTEYGCVHVCLHPIFCVCMSVCGRVCVHACEHVTNFLMYVPDLCPCVCMFFSLIHLFIYNLHIYVLAANRGKAAISSPASVERPLQFTSTVNRPYVAAAIELKTVARVFS